MEIVVGTRYKISNEGDVMEIVVGTRYKISNEYHPEHTAEVIELIPEYHWEEHSAIGIPEVTPRAITVCECGQRWGWPVHGHYMEEDVEYLREEEK